MYVRINKTDQSIEKHYLGYGSVWSIYGLIKKMVL